MAAADDRAQSGRYLVRRKAGGDDRLHRLGEVVTLEHEKLEDRCDAIIQADALRVALVQRRRAARSPMRRWTIRRSASRCVWIAALRGIALQLQATQAFLQDLTSYNIAIARYALALFPTEMMSDELVAKLTIARARAAIRNVQTSRLASIHCGSAGSHSLNN